MDDLQSSNRPTVNQNNSNTANITFEAAMAGLDETVQALEAGDLHLAKATQLYEKGMSFARICNEMLTAAELKITQIQTSYGEQMQVPPESQLEQKD